MLLGGADAGVGLRDLILGLIDTGLYLAGVETGNEVPGFDDVAFTDAEFGDAAGDFGGDGGIITFQRGR